MNNYGKTIIKNNDKLTIFLQRRRKTKKTYTNQELKSEEWQSETQHDIISVIFRLGGDMKCFYRL